MTELPNVSPIISEDERAGLRSQIMSLSSKGNTDAVKHGAATRARKGVLRLMLPKLGKRYTHVHHAVLHLRRQLAVRIEQLRGSVTHVEEATIALACEQEVTRLLACKLLQDVDKPTPEQVLGWRKVATEAAARRNVCIGRLNLDGVGQAGDTGGVDWAIVMAERDMGE